MFDWLILTATLPTHPSALRVRVWRALKTTGAGTLREGVHILPTTAPTADALRAIERTIADSGADAYLLEVAARDAAQERSFRSLFDRSEHYAELLQSLKEARRRVAKESETESRRALRALDQRFQSVQGVDFFGSANVLTTGAALAVLRREIDLRWSPGEPNPTATVIQRQRIADYQRRTWATRKRPWVDRLATAWLVCRFIDKQPSFVWLADPAKCPKTALGYDFDGARFTHLADKVTFEVVAATFGLDEADPALRRVGALVHAIDVGGPPVDEAAGFEMLVRGLQAQYARDDELLAAALPLFDALYAAMKVSE